nr:MBL fold metallo-hydrolase [Thermus amyloliquefaciens]
MASGGRLLEHLALAGYAPEDITHVFLTHGHPDHIGGLVDAPPTTSLGQRWAISAVRGRGMSFCPFSLSSKACAKITRWVPEGG